MVRYRKKNNNNFDNFLESATTISIYSTLLLYPLSGRARRALVFKICEDQNKVFEQFLKCEH